mmetsp:Transcript_22825/g.47977  ORF Transcript_22825/g.47977 Transcript_22825/m.47977 type:complete len:231 (-) Transcript_22825:137-829(-)
MPASAAVSWYLRSQLMSGAAAATLGSLRRSRKPRRAAASNASTSAQMPLSTYGRARPSWAAAKGLERRQRQTARTKRLETLPCTCSAWLQTSCCTMSNASVVCPSAPCTSTTSQYGKKSLTRRPVAMTCRTAAGICSWIAACLLRARESASGPEGSSAAPIADSLTSSVGCKGESGPSACLSAPSLARSAAVTCRQLYRSHFASRRCSRWRCASARRRHQLRPSAADAST